MLCAPQRQLTLLACFLLAPILGHASTIVLNLGAPGQVCEAGTCPPSAPVPDILASGAKLTNNYSFLYVAPDSDWYDITGNYSATNPVSGDTAIVFNASVEYLGLGGVNATPSAAADTFTVTDLQDYNLASSTYFMNFGTLNGIYSEAATSGVIGPPGGSWQAQLFYNDQGLPILGPFTGPGFASNAPGTPLTGFGAGVSQLNAAYVFTYDFAKGTPSGTGFTSTPEPGGLIPVATILILCLGVPAIRRSGLFSKQVG